MSRYPQKLSYFHIINNFSRFYQDFIENLKNGFQKSRFLSLTWFNFFNENNVVFKNTLEKKIKKSVIDLPTPIYGSGRSMTNFKSISFQFHYQDFIKFLLKIGVNP